MIRGSPAKFDSMIKRHAEADAAAGTNREVGRSRSSPSVVRLEKEVAKLRRNYSQREEAVARLAAAVVKLRRANGALNEENSLLRLEVERLRPHARGET
jgi:hypothetical protein